MTAAATPRGREALKPCPFCGGEAEIVAPLGWGNVRASECGGAACAASGPWACNEAEAVTAWNTRAGFAGISDPAAFMDAARGMAEAIDEVMAGSGVSDDPDILMIETRSYDKAMAALAAFHAATGHSAFEDKEPALAQNARLVGLLAKAVGDIAAALNLADKTDLIPTWTANYVAAINDYDAREMGAAK